MESGSPRDHLVSLTCSVEAISLVWKMVMHFEGGIRLMEEHGVLVLTDDRGNRFALIPRGMRGISSDASMPVDPEEWSFR